MISLLRCIYWELRRRLRPPVYSPVGKPCLQILKNEYVGRRCFVIGNGPSVAGMDLEPLNAECTMIVNKGFMLKRRGLRHATFYGISDRGAYKEYGEQIPLDYADHFCVFGAVPWRRGGKVSAIAMYAEESWRHHMSAGFFQFDLNRPVAHTYTVVLQMLQMAVYAGFKEIYFIGVDNDFTGANMHFYPDSDAERINMQVWGIDPCADNEKAFAVAREILAAKGIQLFNAGVGGALGALPRVEFESLWHG